MLRLVLFLSGGLDSSLNWKNYDEIKIQILKAFNIDFEEHFEGYKGEIKRSKICI